MNDQPVLGRIDGGNAAVMPLVVERRRCEDADRFRERREAGPGLRSLAVTSPTNGFFVGRALAVRTKGNAQVARIVFRSARLAAREQRSADSSAGAQHSPASGFA